jgi:ABC-type dipeptide/oligopeptide/nickel transport system permease subunit
VAHALPRLGSLGSPAEGLAGVTRHPSRTALGRAAGAGLVSGVAVETLAPVATRTDTLVGDAWRRFRRNRLAVIGLLIVAVIVTAAVFAPWLAPQDPAKQSLFEKRARPGGKYILGADEFGRDILSRVIYGARVALVVGLVSVGIALGAGLVLGSLAGFLGGWVDGGIMRGVEVLLAFPYLLLAIAVVSALGPGALNTTIAVGIWGTPPVTRIVRGAVLALAETEYVRAARALGAAGPALVTRHILPNILPTVIVYGTLFMANAILVEAALSFLGLGVQPPTPSWGLMVATGRDFLLITPHITTIPGLAIMLAVLGFNLLGDGLRDALDPRLRGA